MVQNLLTKHTAHNPHVLATKQTLYRTGYDSPIVKLLLKPLKVKSLLQYFIEVKARFDEEIDMEWVKHLEKESVQVIYGLV